MTKKIENYLIFFFFLVPIFLITGPALPDIIISLCGLYFLISFIILNKNFLFLEDKLFIFSIFFWFSILFISFFAFDKRQSFQDSLIFIRFLIIPTLGYFLFFNDEKRIKIAVTIIFCSVCFVTIDTLFQFLNYKSEDGFGSDLLGFKSDWYGRLTGPFGDELIPGAYISKFGLIGYLFFFFLKNFKYKNILEIIYLSTIGLVCFGSGERMAFATYFLALFTLLLFFKYKRFVFFSAIIISIILINISLKFHPFYNDFKVIESSHLHLGMKIEKYFNCEEDVQKKCKKIINIQPSFTEVIKNFSSSAYGEIYNVGLNMFINNPLTGVGIGNYQDICLNTKKYNDLMINYKCASHPHNIYIQWLSEGGIITFISFILFLSCIAHVIIKGSASISFKLISFVSLLILFWPIMSTGSLIKNWNGASAFYIIGLCICLARIKINLKSNLY